MILKLKPLKSINATANNKKNDQYHKRSTIKPVISADIFYRNDLKSFGTNNMKLNDKLIKLDRETNLGKSPVSFLIPILLQFSSGKIDYEEMAKQIKQKTIEAQYYFSNMSQEEINKNLRIFKKEFKFADSLNKALFGEKAESEFESVCSKLIDKYNN